MLIRSRVISIRHYAIPIELAPPLRLNLSVQSIEYTQEGARAAGIERKIYRECRMLTPPVTRLLDSRQLEHIDTVSLAAGLDQEFQVIATKDGLLECLLHYTAQRHLEAREVIAISVALIRIFPAVWCVRHKHKPIRGQHEKATSLSPSDSPERLALENYVVTLNHKYFTQTRQRE